MNNIVIINASGITEYALKEIGNRRNSIEYAVEAALKMPISAQAAIIDEESPSQDYLSGFKLKKLETPTASGLIKTLIELSEGWDNIFYFYADCPLTDTALAGKMYENHLKYFSEYTFADGYPDGISVEILKPSILPLLARIAETNDVSSGRDTVFSLIEKDINSFDIETEISPDDQRLLRLSFYPDTRRNYIQLKALMALLPEQNRFESKLGFSGEVLKTVRSKAEVLRTLPVFFEIETTGTHPQNISYIPEAASPEGSLTPGKFKEILAKISDYSGDAVISLSVRNEPSVHPAVAELAAAVLDYPDFRLLIETSGTFWPQEQLDRILNLDAERLTWIIDLDALDRELYQGLRGSGRDEAYKFASMMVGKSPDNVWLQAVRMKGNEADMEQFYKYWKERTNNVIIQKYDWCCGRLDQKKVTDLSPVKRLPCWHLKREMIILLDGTVPLCRDDLDRTMVLGNIFSDDMETVWQNGKQYYRQHLIEEYPDLCRNCDEYYTYNY